MDQERPTDFSLLRSSEQAHKMKMDAAIDIVVVGCINTDLVSFVPRLPSVGETVFSDALETHFGGKGANQAAQAALLMQCRNAPSETVFHECAFSGSCEGAEDALRQNGAAAATLVDDSSLGAAKRQTPICGVAMVGRVGRDTAGLSFIRHFRSLGIETRGISMDSDKRTGTALVTVAHGGENTIAYVPGANASLRREHITIDPAASLLRNAKVVVSENGIPGEISVECFRIAKEGNSQVLTIFTPAPVDRVNPEICCFTDFLLCNSVEARLLVKMWGKGSIASETNVEEIARQLHEVILRTASKFPQGLRGRANVVITRGSQPCVLFANGRIIQVPVAKTVPSELVVDTTGAGDSFAGSLAYFLLKMPASPEVAVSRATFVAAQSVTKKGAAESYAGKRDLPDHLFQPQ
ncbi:ribokinase, putative [Eimeria necatrix]|uniref:Ribokinase n=1 Tax=Eimeria necatrix TaxID=51315 RepID=U6MIX8_9EIME|nr:ribokinase, putative [Eimeria necatrix]CDJ62424.1 ribokinase, putative [Eimeria necatrix]